MGIADRLRAAARWGKSWMPERTGVLAGPGSIEEPATSDFGWEDWVPETCPEPEGMIEEGPVLVFDLDGVCAPYTGCDNKTGAYRFHRKMLPPGWGGAGQDNWHPLLPSWMAELENAFRHVAWFSSAGRRGCWCYSRDIGHAPAMEWPWLGLDHPKLSDWYRSKLGAVCTWIASDVPVALLDDWIVYWEGDERSAPDMARLLARPGPVFAVSPDPAMGMGRALVDLLLDFAADPHAARFQPRHAWVIYADPELRWESGSLEDPAGWPTERGRLRQIREDERDYFGHAGIFGLPE